MIPFTADGPAVTCHDWGVRGARPPRAATDRPAL